MLELFLGQIPEAIYFALFMIFTKRLKEKRILFIILMILEYILLTRIIYYNLYFQILYTLISYIILKILYKEKVQITDVFTFMISSIIMIIINVPLYFIIWKTINNFIVYAILAKIILFLLLIIFRNELYNVQKLYKKMWNRNDKIKKKIKTTTLKKGR